MLSSSDLAGVPRKRLVPGDTTTLGAAECEVFGAKCEIMRNHGNKAPLLLSKLNRHANSCDLMGFGLQPLLLRLSDPLTVAKGTLFPALPKCCTTRRFQKHRVADRDRHRSDAVGRTFDLADHR
jgi:hypothetical protein